MKQYVTNSKLAKQYGLKLFAMKEQVYKVPECQHKEPKVTALFHAVNRNPHERSISRVLKYVEGSGELFNQFVDVSRWDKYGSWGAFVKIRNLVRLQISRIDGFYC